ncbi:MAG: response regulator [Candidatus Lokiarchaeota archaeon]|nr:response regulator [Candidatus Lokiarchaeota archaeon]
MTDVTSIIIADDEPLLVDLYCDAISSQGFHITRTFQNGRELMNFLMSTNGRKVIILDHLMPLCDGISIVRKIKKNVNAKDHYFILVTGDVSSVAEAEKAGADEILIKPFRMHMLTKAINNGLSILQQ